MTFALQNRANKDLQANLHALVERDPTAYGVVGWLSKAGEGERMEKLKREIEARESRRQKKGEDVGGKAWTPERRAKFMRTVAERKSATLTLLARMSRYATRRCISMHQCCICGEEISFGEFYKDGGYGRRAHLTCYEELERERFMAPLPEDIRDIAEQLKESAE